MRAIHSVLKKIINGSSQFVIPVFQRDYKWQEAQCQQLWRDVLRSAAQPHGHFLGSMVYIPTEDAVAGFPRYLIIDGQQRLTSITLLLAALRDYIERNKWSGGQDDPTVRKINNQFLINGEEEGDRLRKLKLRRQDDATLAAIVEGTAQPESPSERILEAYDQFALLVGDSDPAVLWAGINKLIIVDVALERGTDNPQQVFESLNSTGKDLSVADLIRNFILMRYGEREQMRLYQDYWTRIETVFAGSDHAFDSFIRDYIALQRRSSKQDKTDALYQAFCELWRQRADAGITVDVLLSGMRDLAEDHGAFSLLRGVDGDLRAAIANIRNLADVPAILVARLLHCWRRSKTMPEKDLLEALTLIESYLLRRAVGREQSRGYWQHFANMAYGIDESRPLNSLKIGFARLPESYRFPPETLFETWLHGEDIYSLRVCRHLLERLENFNSREPSRLENCSIEHILPQNPNLKHQWQAMLGPDWRGIQKSHLHRLGNLTLTGYNSTYKDISFDQKKTMKGGFAESAVRLNRFVREQKQWTKEEIDARTHLMADDCSKIWPGLDVPDALLQEAKAQDLKEQGALSAQAPVAIPDAARPLADMVMQAIAKIAPDSFTIHHRASISYHGPEFFVEIIPRARRLTVILPIPFSELKDPPSFASDTADWTFIINAHNDGGTHLALKRPADVERAVPLLEQAYRSAIQRL